MASLVASFLFSLIFTSLHVTVSDSKLLRSVSIQER